MGFQAVNLINVIQVTNNVDAFVVCWLQLYDILCKHSAHEDHQIALSPGVEIYLRRQAIVSNKKIVLRSDSGK